MANKNHKNTAPKRINLALQGGGSHGAFTWGVLDRLLEDERIIIEGISGTSAGAMNGAIVAQGYAHGGAAGARVALDQFWHKVSELAWMSPVHQTLLDQVTDNWNTDRSPGFMMLETMTQMFSPYQLNPANIHPLRGLLEAMIDVPALQSSDHIKLFVCATNVRTGRGRVFSHQELTVDALLASACLPFLFQAVVIDGDPYWDGGYLGNPALYPLIYGCGASDIVVVEINPLIRKGIPRTPMEILNRLNEITFNSALIAEMRAIAFVQKLIEDDHLKGTISDRLKMVLMHTIAAPDAMQDLGVSSKYNADLPFLLHLREFGRNCTDKWLKATFVDLNIRSSIDIRTNFLDP